MLQRIGYKTLIIYLKFYFHDWLCHMWTEMNTRLWVDACSCLLLVTFVSIVCDCSALTLQCKETGYTGESSYFYRQMESALLRNPNALYTLHTAFFEPNRAPREVVEIDLHLNIHHMGPYNWLRLGVVHTKSN